MTLPFNEEIINDGVINKYNFEHPNFIGFLTPYGEIINETSPFRNVPSGHGVNTPIELFNNFYNKKDEEPMRVYQSIKRILSKLKESNELFQHSISSPYSIAKRLEYDLLYFFLNCYSNTSFLDGIGKSAYNNEETLDLFKDILVQYLGYHYVARTPRTIFTSTFKIYENFYNYLLNDFTIVRIPKMNFERQQKRYIQCDFNEFLISDSELRLKKELQAIKKLVPKEEIANYYR